MGYRQMARSAPVVLSEETPVHPVPSALARRFAQICVTAIAEAIEGSGLTPLQYAVLRHLDYEEGAYQNGLAGRLGIDQSNASLLVEQLVSAGLIDREVDGADRRSRFLRLTKQGSKLVRGLRPKTGAANERLLAVLDPPDRERFLNLLVRVVEGNRELDRPGTGRRKRTVGVTNAVPG
jgi:MarR family transcriptional regulator, lower aerobic nicotinate degradation pathway regulator